MKPKIHEIGIMRSILIVSIVVGHVFAIYGINESKSWILPEGFEYLSYYSWINTFFIGFSLQAFVFISGFLFESAIVNNSDLLSNKTKMLEKKVKRLLLPTLIFGVAYLVIIEDVSPVDMEFYIQLINGPGHLWFLPMLFWCFVIGALLYPFVSGYIGSIWFWIVLVSISVISLFPPSFKLLAPRIFNAFYYFIFFLFGQLCYKRHIDIVKLRKLWCFGLVLLTLCLLYIKYALIPINFNGKSIVIYFLNVSVGLVGSLMLLKVCCYLRSCTSWVILGSWGGYFGVYLVHQFIIRYLYYHTDILVAMNLPGFSIPLITLILTLCLSYLICSVLLRFEITRRLI